MNLVTNRQRITNSTKLMNNRWINIVVLCFIKVIYQNDKQNDLSGPNEYITIQNFHIQFMAYTYSSNINCKWESAWIIVKWIKLNEFFHCQKQLECFKVIGFRFVWLVSESVKLRLVDISFYSIYKHKISFYFLSIFVKSKAVSIQTPIL